MIPFQEALDKILSEIKPLPGEMVALPDSLGRVIAESICAPRNLPPTDNSAMDGYAFKHGGPGAEGGTLKMIGDIAAGYKPSRALSPGETFKIMTGAPMPEGADTVVPVEDTSIEDDIVTIKNTPSQGANVRKEGEDVLKGDEVIPAGTRVRPAEVGMIASMGRTFIRVRQRPRVAILSTGDEIVEVDAHDPGDKIINSNSHGLAAQVADAGAIPVRIGIGRDDPEGLMEVLSEALLCDVVITTGGVSMGDYDFVRDVLAQWGMEPRFWKVAIKPGKPVLFGMKGSVPVFGLPGNPVSALVSFEQFVRPALRKLMGAKRLFRPVFKALLTEEAGALETRGGRTEFIRCIVKRHEGTFKVTFLGRRGSGMLSTLVEANALLILPTDRSKVVPGELVDVQIFDYDFFEGSEPGW
ncbi:MAG: hypothetical protein C0608_02330 [Deltaproteobacteria bacterium]|nr:MAG: hypothetical protein C0608_02330 [Deltaproteobacteria bacterium]